MCWEPRYPTPNQCRVPGPKTAATPQLGSGCWVPEPGKKKPNKLKGRRGWKEEGWGKTGPQGHQQGKPCPRSVGDHGRVQHPCRCPGRPSDPQPAAVCCLRVCSMPRPRGPQMGTARAQGPPRSRCTLECTENHQGGCLGGQGRGGGQLRALQGWGFQGPSSGSRVPGN